MNLTVDLVIFVGKARKTRVRGFQRADPVGIGGEFLMQLVRGML